MGCQNRVTAGLAPGLHEITQTSASTGRRDMLQAGALNTPHRSSFSPLIMVRGRALKPGLVMECFAQITDADAMYPILSLN